MFGKSITNLSNFQQGLIGPTGPPGPTGVGLQDDCGCTNQMRNILQQASGYVLNVYTTGGQLNNVTIIGVTGINNPNMDGVLVTVSNLGVTGYINISSIEGLVSPTNEQLNVFTLIPEPVPAPENCEAYMERSMRNVLTTLIGTEYNEIHTAGYNIFVDSINAVNYGVVTMGSTPSSSTILVSTCHINYFYKNEPG